MLQETDKENPKSLVSLQRAIHEWSVATFKYDRHPSAVLLAHFYREAIEVAVDPSDRLEYADALILLLGAIAYSPFTVDQIIEAGWDKYGINLAREYGEPEPKTGVIEHRGDRGEPAARRVMAAFEACKGVSTQTLLSDGIRALIYASHEIVGLIETFQEITGISREAELRCSRFRMALSRFPKSS